MKTNRNISIEQAAKNGLKQHEAPFLDADWAAMEALLDEPKKHWILLLLTPFINFKNLKTTIIMTTLFTTTAIGVYYLLSSVSNATPKPSIIEIIPATSTKVEMENAKTQPKSEETKSSNQLIASNSKLNQSKETVSFLPSENKLSEQNPATTKDPAVKSTGIKTSPETFVNLTHNQTVLPTDTPPLAAAAKKVKKTLVREVWVNPVYESVRIRHEGDIDDFWIGIHYTQEGIDYSDSNKTHGFNVQFMSGNLIKNTPFAFYGGLDWGMQFRGRGKRQEVILNTVNEDLGFTYLSSVSHDILLRGHLEFPKYPIVPYATFFAGPRIYATGQKVGMYNPPVDTEGSSRDNVQTSALLAMGGGIGARVKLIDYASLDFRYEQFFEETKSVVDLTESRLVGTAYNLELKNQKTDFG